VIGLYFSLSRPHFMSALLWTFLVGIGVPMLLSRLTGRIEPHITVPVQVVLAVVFAGRMLQNLDERIFALERRSA
jgi:hypothetical protein